MRIECDAVERLRETIGHVSRRNGEVELRPVPECGGIDEEKRAGQGGECSSVAGGSATRRAGTQHLRLRGERTVESYEGRRCLETGEAGRDGERETRAGGRGATEVRLGGVEQTSNVAVDAVARQE